MLLRRRDAASCVCTKCILALVKGLTFEHLLALVSTGGAALAFGAFCAALGYHLTSYSSPVVIACENLDERPSGIEFRLTGCEADVSNVAVEEKLGYPVAVYVALRAPNSTRRDRAFVVLRTTERPVREWADEGNGEDALPWAGPRTFHAIDPGPLGGNDDISRDELARHLAIANTDFVIVHEDGNRFGWYTMLALTFAVSVAAAASFVWVVLRIRKRRKARSPERSSPG